MVIAHRPAQRHRAFMPRCLIRGRWELMVPRSRPEPAFTQRRCAISTAFPGIFEAATGFRGLENISTRASRWVAEGHGLGTPAIWVKPRHEWSSDQCFFVFGMAAQSPAAGPRGMVLAAFTRPARTQQAGSP